MALNFGRLTGAIEARLESERVRVTYVPAGNARAGWQRAMLCQDDYAALKRNPDDVADGMDRLKAIGNGQNPLVAATAWNLLSQMNDSTLPTEGAAKDS